jgi:hypothetical protein
VQQRTNIASDPEPFQGYVVEEQGKMIAYFIIREIANEKELLLTEITEVDQLAAQAVLNSLKNYGTQRNLETLSTNISYKEPFAEYLVSLGATKKVPTYAWQIRITDYVRIFRKARARSAIYHQGK